MPISNSYPFIHLNCLVKIIHAKFLFFFQVNLHTFLSRVSTSNFKNLVDMILSFPKLSFLFDFVNYYFNY